MQFREIIAVLCKNIGHALCRENSENLKLKHQYVHCNYRGIKVWNRGHRFEVTLTEFQIRCRLILDSGFWLWAGSTAESRVSQTHGRETRLKHEIFLTCRELPKPSYESEKCWQPLGCTVIKNSRFWFVAEKIETCRRGAFLSQCWPVQWM